MAAMENLLKLSGVQPYVINSAQVVFLNERPTKNGSSSSSGGTVGGMVGGKAVHHLCEIRKSSYHNVVRVAAMENLLELSDVQPYIINSAQVAFLNERPTKNRSSSSSSGGAVSGMVCGKAVQHLCEI
ncbi:Protein RGF1 INDUCIBLE TRANSCRIPTION FACTOR 1, partial [Linum grandiflorum]